MFLLCIENTMGGGGSFAEYVILFYLAWLVGCSAGGTSNYVLKKTTAKMANGQS